MISVPVTASTISIHHPHQYVRQEAAWLPIRMTTLDKAQRTRMRLLVHTYRFLCRVCEISSRTLLSSYGDTTHQAPLCVDATSSAAAGCEAVPSEAAGEITVGMGFLPPMPCAIAKGDGRCSTGAATAIAKGLSEVTGIVPKLSAGGASPWQKP